MKGFGGGSNRVWSLPIMLLRHVSIRSLEPYAYVRHKCQNVRKDKFTHTRTKKLI